MMTETEALIYVMEIYSQTDKAVSQGFYQALCRKAIGKLKSQTEHIKLLQQCDDTSTEVISKMDEEIKILKERNQHLKVVIAAQKQTIRNQGIGNEEKHNILCGIKEEIDNYFGDI